MALQQARLRIYSAGVISRPASSMAKATTNLENLLLSAHLTCIQASSLFHVREREFGDVHSVSSGVNIMVRVFKGAFNPGRQRIPQQKEKDD